MRRRKASDDGQMHSKRVNSSSFINPSEHSVVSLRDITIKGRKTKPKSDPDRAMRRSIINSDEPLTSLEKVSVQVKKREASDDGALPEKNTRSNSSISNIKSGTAASKSSKEKYKDEDLIFNNVSPEEEKIYQLSSLGNRSRADFEKKYLRLMPIGKGGFSSVYNGYRKDDLLQVAIKYIDGESVTLERVVCNGNAYVIILEVALMLKAAGLAGSVGQSTAVSLLDWFILDYELILVMEKPVLSVDLSRYLQAHGGYLEEHEAKIILKQLVDAAVDMHSKGVFHRDIKPENVLIQLESGEPRVRIIDFGCGNFSKQKPFSSFCGTLAYFPPEWFDYETYWACPTTVWQLGVLFYSLLEGHGRFTTTGFINGQVQISPALSTDCRLLLNWCLSRDPALRATLEKLQLCPFLRETSPPPVQGRVDSFHRQQLSP
ncbi:Serine/threonine-protein kinase pim-2 [Channa argus]|uniref:non-specific serine/threonine protein kinase n=2 Tax=Channa argus TaxID=215402 RepID=A0A6G1PTU4_CHAAH|nr:Serine/threonine-protein kinase pim-2 [Channa argus]